MSAALTAGLALLHRRWVAVWGMSLQARWWSKQRACLPGEACGGDGCASLDQCAS